MCAGKYQGYSVVIGLTGGIACYKAVEIVSKMTQQGADVHVIMTEAACKFITPLTLQTVSRNQVSVDMFTEVSNWNVKHISLADRADLFAIVPATANFIGKVANGIADDLLTTTVMATKAPVLIAPAMNVNMYDNSIVKRNITKLQEHGYKFIEPAEGYLACGVMGKGRLADTAYILKAIDAELLPKEKSLKGIKALVTAGGTQEPLDPVRYLGNRSSGKMGYAICQELINQGADVTLVTGPTHISPPVRARTIKVNTAQEMYQACLKEFAHVDVVVKAAAVADFRPKQQSHEKIKKTKNNNDNDFTIQLEKNPDILAELGRLKTKQLLIGFAAETQDLIKNAQEKLKNKNLDLIIANDVKAPNSGFNVDTNQVTLIRNNGQMEEWPLLTKNEVAVRLTAKISELLCDN